MEREGKKEMRREGEGNRREEQETKRARGEMGSAGVSGARGEEKRAREQESKRARRGQAAPFIVSQHTWLLPGNCGVELRMLTVMVFITGTEIRPESGVCMQSPLPAEPSSSTQS